MLTVSKLIAFASPAAPIAAVGLPLVVYLPPFYAHEMGLGLSVVGTVFMITRFWDVLADPVLGVLSDRLHSRWGRRRHWLALSVPVVVASAAMVFLPTPPVSAGYLLVWLIVLYVGWSLLTIAHMSWGAELTPDYNERSRVQGWREVFLIGGMITALALPALIERTDPTATGADRMEAMGWYIVLLLPLTVAWAVLTVPEQPVPDQPPLGWRRAMAIVVNNRPLRRLLLMDLVGGLGGGIIAALFLFVAVDRLALGSWASVLLLVYFVAGVIFVPLMVRLSYRLGKHRTLAASSLFSGVTLPLLFLLPTNHIPLAAATFALFGVNMGAGPFLFRSIMADVADHDRVESGAQRTGLYFSLLTMTNKVGHALSIGVVYPLLEWIGYVPGAANAPGAIAGLTAIAVWPPVVCALVVAAFMWRFPIDIQRQAELRAIIEASADPGSESPFSREAS
jgi:glycoside/pentoside/hexuronide:cation symporter, GPH family